MTDLPGGIELADGGCIVARATPLHFSRSSFLRRGAPPAGFSGDFNILGATGAPAATPPAPPAPGQAPAGAPGVCSSAGIAGEPGMPGAAGQQGMPGAAGPPGNNGIASAVAIISITQSLELELATKKLLVATQSGQGGTGGQGAPGQQGGKGGPGGDGGNGADAGHQPISNLSWIAAPLSGNAAQLADGGRK